MATIAHPELEGTVEVPDRHVALWAKSGWALAKEAKPVSPAPAKSAGKPEWVDFAVAQGLSRANAEAATKEELVARFGG